MSNLSQSVAGSSRNAAPALRLEAVPQACKRSSAWFFAAMLASLVVFIGSRPDAIGFCYGGETTDKEVNALVKKLQDVAQEMQTAQSKIIAAQKSLEVCQQNFQNAQRKNAEVLAKIMRDAGVWNKDTPQVKALKDYKDNTVVLVQKYVPATRKYETEITRVPTAEYLQCCILFAAISTVYDAKKKGNLVDPKIEAAVCVMLFGPDQTTWIDAPKEKEKLEQFYKTELGKKYLAGIQRMRELLPVGRARGANPAPANARAQSTPETTKKSIPEGENKPPRLKDVAECDRLIAIAIKYWDPSLRSLYKGMDEKNLLTIKDKRFLADIDPQKECKVATFDKEGKVNGSKIEKGFKIQEAFVILKGHELAGDPTPKANKKK